MVSQRRFCKATITEVAARAGVSAATVSRLLGGHSDVCSPETARRVREAAAVLHYTPGAVARGSRERETRTIGVCMQLPLDDLTPDFENFYAERLTRGINMAAASLQYSLLFYSQEVRVGSSCAPFLDGRVDGLLYHVGNKTTRPRQTAAAGLPSVVLALSRDLAPGCGAAYADERDTANLALGHLWGLGHRRIAHLAGPVTDHPHGNLRQKAHDSAIGRQESVVRWLSARGAHDPALISAEHSWREAEPQVRRTWEAWRAASAPPTAVFCANDHLARTLIAAAQASGWHVPRDLSVVGVDNQIMPDGGGPPLTTVDVPVREVGKVAVRALLRLMAGEPAEDCRVAVPVTNLVVRATTALPAER